MANVHADATRAAARAALVTLVFQEEAAASAATLAAGGALSTFAAPPEYLSWGVGADATMGAVREDARPGGGSTQDVMGVIAGVALACGAAPVSVPDDRIATTVMFAAPAEGATTEALNQRAMHRHTLVLQGAYPGEARQRGEM